MTETRIHRAVSTDGTEIAGHVVGEGPPLVLVHGMIGDGDSAWTELLPHLTNRFTCYLPSSRGRGLSGDNSDHSMTRHFEDIAAFVATIGEPVRLMGWSGGGPLVLGLAEQLDSVAAVAAFETGTSPAAAPELMDDFGPFVAAMEQVGIAAGEGRLVDAVHAFLPGICTDEEIAALDGTGRHEEWAVTVPDGLVMLENMFAETGPGPLDPAALAQITAPTLFLVGSKTALDAFPKASRKFAGQISTAQVREIAGVGHFAPVVAPEAVAAELTAFFEAALQPA